MGKTGEIESGSQPERWALARKLNRPPKTSVITSYRCTVLPPQTNAVVARKHAQSYQIQHRQERGTQTDSLLMLSCPQAPWHGRVHPRSRQKRPQLGRDQPSFSVLAVRPPSCAAAQRGNASERKASLTLTLSAIRKGGLKLMSTIVQPAKSCNRDRPATASSNLALAARRCTQPPPMN